MEVVEDASAETVRVSTLELFFDLVFVFTITQLTSVLVRHETWQGLLSIVLMLGVIWWMYGGYAWLTNAVPPNRTDRRLLGVALYLAGDIYFRRTLSIGPNTTRTLAAAGALATVPLGLAFGGVLQLVALVALLAIVLAVEKKQGSPLPLGEG